MTKKNLNVYQLIVFLVMPFLLSWPSWFNGQPFFFPDTTAYIKGAASAVDLVVKTDQARNWLTPKVAHQAPPAQNGGTFDVTVEQYSSSPEKGGVISGRSIYYGMFVFLTAILLGLNWVPVLQALISTVMISSLLRAQFSISYKVIAAALLFLALATPLPYFNSMLMPDVFAGLGLAGIIGLLLMPQAPFWSRVLWATLTAAATLFHTGNILVILSVIIALVLICVLLGQKRMLVRSNVLLALALVSVGIAGELAFGYAIHRVTDTPPIRPPFMTARLLADGPGTDFIRDHCSQAQFEICNYPKDYTKVTSDDILWSMDPGMGVFTLAPKAVRLKLGQQDLAFAKAVFFHYPWPVIQNSVRNIGLQLGLIGLEEFTYSSQAKEHFAQKIPEAELDVMQGTKAARGEFNVAYSEAIIITITIGSLLVCLAAVIQCYRRQKYYAAILISVFLLGILINASVTGVLSTPHDRYQARIVWMLELMGFMLCLYKFGMVQGVLDRHVNETIEKRKAHDRLP